MIMVDLVTGSTEAGHSLYRWLKEDPTTSRLVKVEVATGVMRDEMGSTLDVVSAVIADVTSIGSLIVACLAWRDSRGKQSDSLNITRQGRFIDLSEASPNDIAAIVDHLLRDH